MGNESSTLAERDYRILAEEYRKHVECNVSKKSVAAAAAAGEGWPTEISALWPRLQGKELQAALRGDWRGHGSAHISILKGSKSGAGASSMSQARSDFLRRAACALTLSRMANASASDSIEEGHHHYRRSDGQQHDKTSSQQPTPRHAKGSGKQQSRSKQNGKLDHPHDYNNGTTTSGFGSTKRGSNGTVNHHCQIAAEQDNEELPTLSEDYSTEHGPDGEEHTLRKRKASQRTRTSSKRYRYSDDDGDEQALDDENEIHADGSEGDGRYHSNSHPFSNMPLKPMNGELPQGTRLQTMKARHSGHAVFEDMQLRACPFQAGSVVVYNLGHIEPERSSNTGSTAYIWPIGYKSRRMYKSLHDPDKRVWYESEIMPDPDTKDQCIIRVTALDEPSYEYFGSSPTQAWQQAIESVNNKTNSRRRVAVSGPQFLGLSDPAVAKELAKLPGYEECRALQLGGRGH